MLGQDLTAHLAPRHQVIPVDRHRADITRYDQIREVIGQAAPDVVIHAAAFTAVDECERQPAIAFRVNAEGTRNVAEACRELGSAMLYLSTDYVFDGEKPAPYLETDQPNPLGVYGKSKLEGERHVSERVPRSWIVRISWLFGPLGKNFVRAILEQARRGGPLRVVDDQVGAPTYTADLAQKLETLLEKGNPGIYHVTNQGYCSWFEFAKEILNQARLPEVTILPIPSSASGRPAPRPRNSRLSNARLKAEGLGLLPCWQDALTRYLAREAEVQRKNRIA